MIGNKLREASQAGPPKTLGEVVFVFQQLLSNYDMKLALDLANYILAHSSLANCELSLTSDDFSKELQPFVLEKTCNSGKECASVLDALKPRQFALHEPRIPAKWSKRWPRVGVGDGDFTTPSLGSQANSDSYSNSLDSFSNEGADGDIFRPRLAFVEKLPEYDSPANGMSLDSLSLFNCSTYAGGKARQRSGNCDNSTLGSSSERRTIRGHCFSGGTFDREEIQESCPVSKPRSLDCLPQCSYSAKLHRKIRRTANLEETQNNPAHAASLDSLPQFARKVTRPNTNRDNAAPIRDSFRRAFRGMPCPDQSDSDSTVLEEAQERQEICLGKSDSLISIGRPCVNYSNDDRTTIDEMLDGHSAATSFRS